MVARPSKPSATSAWVAPNGDFYEVDECGHYRFAQENFGVRTSELESKGWLHLSFTSVFLSRKPTHDQLNTLWDVLAAYAKAGDKYASHKICAKLTELLEEEF